MNDAAVPASSTLLGLEFENLCDRPVTVNLGRLVVSARYRAGWCALSVFDPRGEIRPGLLDPGRIGKEVLQFDPLGCADSPERASPLLVCADLGSIGDERAELGRASVCLASEREIAP
jgi:hypothetical protein